jgi:[protein-PII] uridylyltransferase
MSTKDPYVEIGFVAEDRPGLLAMVTATLTAARLRVVGAQIYSWTDTFGRVRALDLFWVRGSDVAAVYSLMPRIEKDFGRLQSRELAPAELVTGRLNRSSRWSDRPTPQVPTDINIDNRAATGHTVIEVITRDQFGLLFWLSNAIQHAGLTIALAKINTEGNQVADVFYVSDPSGAKLTDPDRIEMLRNQLLSTIARLEGASST